MYHIPRPPFRLLASVVLLGLVHPSLYAQKTLSPTTAYVNPEQDKSGEPIVTFTQEEIPAQPTAAFTQPETPAEPNAAFTQPETPAQPNAEFTQAETPAEPNAEFSQAETPAEPNAAFTQPETPAQPAADLEFNANFFGSEQDVGNLSRFSQSNYVPAGSYNVDVFVNGELKGRADVVYVETAADKTSLCVTSELETLFDLKDEAYEKVSGEACDFAEKRIPKAKVVLDQGTLALKLEIPQALTVVRPRGYIAPALWQDGVPSAFVNYNLSHYDYRDNGYKNQNQYLYLNGGINLFGWALRHTGSMNNSKGAADNRKYQRGVTYLQKGIAALNSELTLGDFTTEGAITDSLSLRGISIATDLRMLPQTQRGYAPRIQGIANTNAVVIIRQNGNVIHQISVPAGQFVINDLYPTGYSGELKVEIHEADGNVRTFSVPYASLISLMRPGQFKYQLAAGRYRYGNTVLKDNAVTGSLEYGLLNNVTLNGGFIGHKKYRSGTFGLAINTPIGAFSGDITQAKAEFGEGEEAQVRKGSSMRASYNYYLDTTKTNVTLATYRYSSRNYYSADETIWYNELDRDPEYRQRNRENLENGLRPKHRYQLSVSQEISDKWGSLYFSGSAINYWNLAGTSYDYNFSYGNNYKMLSYNLGISQQFIGDTRDKQFHVNFSLPLPLVQNPGESQGYYSANTTFRQGGGHIFRQSYSRTIGEYNELSYALASSVENRQGLSATGSLNYRTNYGNIDASITRSSNHSMQYNVGLSGAVVAHPKGITLSDSVGSTFGIVHAKNGYGARLNNGLGKKLDYFGNAIIEHLTPYEYNRIGVDPSDLPINIEFDATEREVVPKANSAMLVNLNAQRNTMVLFNVSLDGQEIPMGTEAKDEQGNSVGYIVQGGMLFANRLSEAKGKVIIQWGIGENEVCHFNYDLPSLNDEQVTETLNVDVQCKRGR